MYSQGHGRGILPFSTDVSRGTGWSRPASWELGKRKREKEKETPARQEQQGAHERGYKALQGEFRIPPTPIQYQAFTSDLWSKKGGNHLVPSKGDRYCICAVVRSTHDHGGKERWERDPRSFSSIFASSSFSQPPLLSPSFVSFPSPSVPLFSLSLSLSSLNCVLIGRDYGDNTSRRVG